MTDSPAFGRREAMAFLAGSAGVGIATSVALPVVAQARDRRRAFNFASPADRARAYMMMRGALDDRLVIGCVDGRYYGVVNGELTPLFGVVSATFSRYRVVPDGSVRAVSFEQAYFTDPVTGEALSSYVNPYTGQAVDVPTSGYAPATFTIEPNLDLKLGRVIPGLDFEHKVMAPQVRGDDVWITEVTRTASNAPGQAQAFRYSESTILHARLSELESATAKRVRCETSFTNVVSWRPWLKMGERPGHMMAIGAGRYGATMEELSPAWTAATGARHPELLSDPAKLLQPLWDAT